MPHFTSTVDGALLHYVDYVPTKAEVTTASSDAQHDGIGMAKRGDDRDITLVFIHGWPMSHRMYEHLLLRLCCDHGVRCIASDRRGFGHSEWSGAGKGKESGSDQGPTVTYQTFAQDTLDLLNGVRDGSRGLGQFYFVAASMGCGETLLAYHAMELELKESCLGFVWLGPSLPFPLQTAANPKAPGREVWEGIVAAFRHDRVGFTKQALPGVFGMGEAYEALGTGMKVELSSTTLDRFEGIVNGADAMAVVRCVDIITTYDFTDSLRRLEGQDVKVLCIHGDSDLGMPAEASASVIPTLATQTQVKIYAKAAHGLYLTHADQLVEEILSFVFGT